MGMKWLVLFGTLLIMGCSSVDIAKKGLIQRGSEISDSALIDAEWWVCTAATVGSVKRRYGLTQERANLYREFCDGSGTANVVAP